MDVVKKTLNGLAVTLLGDRDFRVERVFNAPREKVWRAHVEPELVAQWWGHGNKLVIERLEVTRGGRWRFVEHTPEGDTYGFEGRFREVTPMDRLAYTIEFDGMPGYVVLNTITFEDLGNGRTRLVTDAQCFTGEERDGMLDATEGMAQTFAVLDRVLAAMK